MRKCPKCGGLLRVYCASCMGRKRTRAKLAAVRRNQKLAATARRTHPDKGKRTNCPRCLKSVTVFGLTRHMNQCKLTSRKEPNA